MEKIPSLWSQVKLQGRLALFLEENSKKNQNIKCHAYYLCVIVTSCG